MSNQSKKYFHDTYFKKILKLSEGNRLEEAICEFQNYIENYPNDLCGYVYYADAWIRLGNFEEAEKVLKMAVVTQRTSQASKEEYEMIKIKLLCGQGKYEECLELLKRNIDIFRKNDWSFFGALIFLKKQLGVLEPRDYENAQGKYLMSQIISYNEELALSCIESYMPNSDYDGPFKFVEDFPIREVYFKVREMLPLENKIYNEIISNFYIFKYDSCGRFDSRSVDYLAVITLKDSNDIITMYPYENKERRKCIDLTPKTQDSPKAKRISQIDKFNQRYGKMVDKK